MFETGVLREISTGPKRDGVAGEWRRLHNGELHVLHSSPNIFRLIKSRIMGWAGHVVRTGDRGGACRVLVGRHGVKSLLGRPRCKREDNIKLDLQEVGWGMAWIDLAQERDRCRALGNVITNLRVP